MQNIFKKISFCCFVKPGDEAKMKGEFHILGLATRILWPEVITKQITNWNDRMRTVVIVANRFKTTFALPRITGNQKLNLRINQNR